MTWGGRPAISWPSKQIRPASGRRNPLTRLNSVVLPAPFGPMSAVIEPRLTSKPALSTACRPPKRFRTPSTTRIGLWGSGVEIELLLLAEQPLWTERHERHDQEADDDVSERRHLLRRDRQVKQDA